VSARKCLGPVGASKGQLGATGTGTYWPWPFSLQKSINLEVRIKINKLNAAFEIDYIIENSMNEANSLKYYATSIS
jgi:hypothetical protein